MKINKMMFISLLLVGIILIQACNSEENVNSDKTKDTNKEHVLKLAHTNAPSDVDPYTAISEKFKETVEKESDGRIKVEIYSGGQMGGELEEIQKVQNNVIQASLVASNNISEHSPSLGALDLPYLFESVEDFNKVISENGELINDTLKEEAKIEAIAWTHQGFRVISTSKEIKNVDDLKGFKIRLPENKIQIKTFENLGASPTPIAVDELYNSLQQNVVEAQENPYVSIYTNKFHEVADYISEPSYKLWVGPLIINQDFLKELPDELESIVRDAGKDMEDFSNEKVIKQEEEAKKAIKEEGVEILGAPEDEDVWKESSMDIWPEFYDDIGDLTVLDAVLETLDKEKP